MKKPTTRKQKIRRSNVRARLIIFGTLAVLLILFSIFSEYLTPYDPYFQDLSIAKSPPSAEHLLGTDRYGRDMLSRVMVGSRTSFSPRFCLLQSSRRSERQSAYFVDGEADGWTRFSCAFPICSSRFRDWCSRWLWRVFLAADCKTRLLRWQRSPGPNTRALPEARRLPRRKPSG